MRGMKVDSCMVSGASFCGAVSPFCCVCFLCSLSYQRQDFHILEDLRKFKKLHRVNVLVGCGLCFVSVGLFGYLTQSRPIWEEGTLSGRLPPLNRLRASLWEHFLD